MKALREYWRVESAHFCGWFEDEDEAMRTAGYYAQNDPTFTINFVELPPGHIVVSRERLRDVLVYCFDERTHLYQEAIERELFGETNER